MRPGLVLGHAPYHVTEGDALVEGRISPGPDPPTEPRLPEQQTRTHCFAFHVHRHQELWRELELARPGVSRRAALAYHRQTSAVVSYEGGRWNVFSVLTIWLCNSCSACLGLISAAMSFDSVTNSTFWIAANAAVTGIALGSI